MDRHLDLPRCKIHILVNSINNISSIPNRMVDTPDSMGPLPLRSYLLSSINPDADICWIVEIARMHLLVNAISLPSPP